MSPDGWRELVDVLMKQGLVFESGLTDAEVEYAQQIYEFKFPPDLRALLQTALPVGEKFANWRIGKSEALFESLYWPIHSFLFDVEHSDFWLPEWGQKPQAIQDALKVAEARVGEAPKLIPIYSHRYIPEAPHESGNPVFSVYQTDVIWYGFDLEDYLRHEFQIPGRRPWPETVKQITFWDPERFQQICW